MDTIDDKETVDGFVGSEKVILVTCSYFGAFGTYKTSISSGVNCNSSIITFSILNLLDFKILEGDVFCDSEDETSLLLPLLWS